MASGTIPIPAFGDGSSYVKIADGTLIQWGFQTANIATGSDHADYTITYPIAFHSSTNTPKVVTSIVGMPNGPSSQTRVCIPTAIGLTTSATKLSSFTLRVWKQASVGTDTNPEPDVCWIAIGRWK